MLMEVDYLVIGLPKNKSHYLITTLFKVFVYDCKQGNGDFKENLESIAEGSIALVYNLNLVERFHNLDKIESYDFRDYIWCRENKVPEEFKINNFPALMPFKNFYNNQEDYMEFIPKTKLKKILKGFCDNFIKSTSLLVQTFDNYYRHYVRYSFTKIEQSFVKCDTQILQRFYPKVNTCGWLPTKYNLHTTTGRPSCSYGGINFLALSKESGVRTSFISRFKSGLLMDFDFDAYNLRIIAKFLIDLPFSNDINVHEYLASQILGKPEITEAEYHAEKLNSFWYLFGDSKKDISKLPPFYRKVMEFRKELHAQYNAIGEVYTFGAKRPIAKRNLLDLTEPTLFNYYVQAFETEISSLFIKLALSALYGMQSKLILYTYDSLLIDTHPEEKDEVIKRFENALPKYRLKVGKNYGEMLSI